MLTVSCSVNNDLDELGGGCGVVPGIQGEYSAPSDAALGNNQLNLTPDCGGSAVLRFQGSNGDTEYQLDAQWNGLTDTVWQIELTCRSVTYHGPAGPESSVCQRTDYVDYGCIKEGDVLDCVSLSELGDPVDWMPVAGGG
jgi:hypothetical protein